MKTPTCATCMYSTPAVGADKKIDFLHRICKFMPPRPTLLPNPQGGIQVQPLWPILAADQWCGQWNGGNAVTMPPPASEEDVPLPGERPLKAKKADA